MIIGSQGHSSCWVRWGSIKVCFDIEIGLQLPFFLWAEMQHTWKWQISNWDLSVIIGLQGHSLGWVTWGSHKVCFGIEISLQLPLFLYITVQHIWKQQSLNWDLKTVMRSQGHNSG